MEWMTHPLKYYRFKSKPRKDGQPSKDAGGKDPAEARKKSAS